MKAVMVMQTVGVAAGPWCSFSLKCSIYGCIIDACIFNNHFFILVATKDMFERVFFGIMQPVLPRATDSFFAVLYSKSSTLLE